MDACAFEASFHRHSFPAFSILHTLFNVTVSYFWLSYEMRWTLRGWQYCYEMKCLKPKTQKHKTNIVKYSCLYQGNSALNIFGEENYFPTPEHQKQKNEGMRGLTEGMKFTVHCWNTSFIHFCHKLYYVVVSGSYKEKSKLHIFVPP